VTTPLSDTIFVGGRLGLAMFNPHIKSEMSTITCNEGTNFRFEPPFGDLGVTYTVHLWLARLPISENWIFFAISQLRHY